MSDAYVTLLDLAKRSKYGGGIDDVIEVLAETNPILKDAPIIEGNLPTGNRTTVRTTLPSGTWRQLNQGVDTERSTTKQVDDTCGMLEGYSAIDDALVAISGDKGKFRASEDNAFVSGLSNTAAAAIISADIQTDPEKMHGLIPRYNSTTSGDGKDNIVLGGGSGSDNSSVWIVKWSPMTAHLIFPKGTQAGLKSEDLGRIPWEDADGKHYQAWVTHFMWYLGLSVRDYRYISRVANIDISELTLDAASGTDLMDDMLDAYYKVPTQDLGNMAQTFVYCNKTIAKWLHKQAMNKSNVNLTLDSAAGQPFTRFLGAPVHVCDAIGIAEAVVS